MQALSASVESLRQVGRAEGGFVPGLVALGERAERLAASAKGAVQTRCLAVACEAYTLAGWTAFDAGLRSRAWGLYDRALAVTSDPRATAQALLYAGHLDAEAGRHNDALRLFQLAGIKLDEAPRDDPALRASIEANAATALASIGRGDLARDALSRATDAGELDLFNTGDLEWRRAETLAAMGKLDAAHEHAAQSLESWPAGCRRDALKAEITKAGLYRRAGESAADEMLRGVRQRVEATGSQRARWRLAAAEGALPA